MNHRTGTGPVPNAAFSRTLEDYVAAENPCASWTPRRSLDLHALDLPRPMRGHGLSALRSGGAAQTVSLWLSASDSFVAAVGGRMPSERGGDLAAGQAGAGLQNHRRLPEGQPQAAAGVNRQFTVLCQKLKLFGANCWPLTGASLRRSTRGTRTSMPPSCRTSSSGPTRGWRSISSNWTPPMRPNRREGAHESRTGGEDRGVAGEAGVARRTAGATG